jgi:hypothetical protein
VSFSGQQARNYNFNVYNSNNPKTYIPPPFDFPAFKLPNFGTDGAAFPHPDVRGMAEGAGNLFA